MLLYFLPYTLNRLVNCKLTLAVVFSLEQQVFLVPQFTTTSSQVVYSDCVCVSENLRSLSCVLVDFFFLSTDTTQHIHTFLIRGAQILFYKSQIKKLIHSHICSYCCSIFSAKHICVPVSNNVKLWTEFEYVQI